MLKTEGLKKMEEWVLSDHFKVAIIAPMLISLVIFGISSTQEKKAAFVSLFCFIPLSFLTSYWSDGGLHIHPWPAIAFLVICLRKGLGTRLVYSVAFTGSLVGDLVIARNHIDYPYGIGGAGLLDGLVVFPIAFLAIGWVLTKNAKYIEMSHAYNEAKKVSL